MFSNLQFPVDKEEFQAGVREGVQMSDDYLKEICRDFYKSVKRGLLELKMTTSTATTHTCNCDYCPANRKPLKF